MAHLLRSGIALALVLGPNAGVASAQQINGQDLPIGPTANRVNVPDPGCTGNVTYDDSLKTFLQAGGIIAEIAGGLPGAVIEGALDALSVFIKGSSSQNFANCAVSCVQFIKEQEARVSKVSGYFQTNRPGFSPQPVDYSSFCKSDSGRKNDGYWQFEYLGKKLIKGSTDVLECTVFKNWSDYDRTFHTVVDLGGPLSGVPNGRHVAPKCLPPAPPRRNTRPENPAREANDPSR